MKFQPVSEKDNNVFRDDQSPKILRSINYTSCNVSMNDVENNNLNTRYDNINAIKSTGKNYSRNLKNNSLINLNELPFIHKSDNSRDFSDKCQLDEFEKTHDYRYKKSTQKIEDRFNNEYQNFLNNLYNN